MTAALELPLEVVEHVGACAPYLGPAQAFDGGVAHVGGDEHFSYIWYSVPQDERPCPFCGLAVDDALRCVAIMADGDWRWAHAPCALAAKGGRSDMAIGAPWKRREWGPCAKCGGERGPDHVHAYGEIFCDDECTQRYEEVTAV